MDSYYDMVDSIEELKMDEIMKVRIIILLFNSVM